MSRKFITTIVAAAIAVTTISATPAFADGHRTRDDQLGALLLGAAAIFVIGKAINDRKKRENKAQVTTRNVAPQYTPQHSEPPRATRKSVLPAYCVRNLNTADGRQRVVGLLCLERNYGNVDHLPRNCLRGVETRNGQRWGYAPRCLRRNGYRIANG